MEKTYGEYCGLARSLDYIGDRWTLLIVRELLVRPARYSDLQDGLPGIATNLLAQRLRQLEQDGIVRRRLDVQRSGVVYEVTSLGADLEETVLALVRWGTTWMQLGQGEDAFRPSWLVIALRALLPDTPISPNGSVEVWCGGEAVTVTRDANGLSVALGSTEKPHAKLTGDPSEVLGLAARFISIDEARHAGARVEGSSAALRRALFARAST
jgi:DNA-binding HxlR family transcriptional regulator